MIKRFLENYLLRDAQHYPVLTLTGPRQSGKTTLARATFASHRYISLEQVDQKRFAREDPRGFLAQFRGSVIIDEVQHAPDLISYIQGSVDEDPSPGRFVPGLPPKMQCCAPGKRGRALPGVRLDDRDALLDLMNGRT